MHQAPWTTELSERENSTTLRPTRTTFCNGLRFEVMPQIQRSLIDTWGRHKPAPPFPVRLFPIVNGAC